MSRPRVLIEDWLPVKALGIESRRERGAASALPPLSFLHVWWARRPLVASAAAILGSCLPPWTPELSASFAGRPEIVDVDSYRKWFLTLLGILGDPVTERARLDAANRIGIKLAGPGYSYRQAFRNNPSDENVQLLHALLIHQWGELPKVLDPTAGGGSIPFESARYKLPTSANDLNPVAGLVLRSSLDIPNKFGSRLRESLEKWGEKLCDEVGSLLGPLFPVEPSEQVLAYIHARTVSCPRTGKIVPLVPNWWLAPGKEGVAVRPVTERNGQELDELEFQIVSGAYIDFDPKKGTVLRGEGISPWDGLAIDGDYIKGEAQSGRMGHQLYAIATRTSGGRGYRVPSAADIRALEDATSELAARLQGWKESDCIPTERIPIGLKTGEPHRYGINEWSDMFSARQLVVHGMFVEQFRKLVPAVRSELGAEEGDAVLTLLALMQPKALNWNAALSSWNVNRTSMRSVFDRHDFAFKWTYAEFDGARQLFPWCLSQILDAYSGICSLLEGAPRGGLLKRGVANAEVEVTARNGADLAHVETGSIGLVCVDPPYYDNVMYAELADFFYVWEKRTLAAIHPDLFVNELTDKKNEAVANPSRFRDAGKRSSQLANADYEAKMTAIFSESYRVLREDGVLCVMFTHKRAEAWDTLGMALMEAGFTIETSWPVNTEFEHSLHQARKNAAASTIFLVCRKRESSVQAAPFFEDLEPEVRAAARDALERFAAAGIQGVDLLLSTYGPSLSVISNHWPVLSSEIDELTGKARTLRPEEALDAARAEVVRLQRQNLVGATVQLDPLTDFSLIAWSTFEAEEFPYDEARRLALATGGLDVDDLFDARILEKRAGSVVILPPAKRVRRENDDRSGVRRDATSFACMIDAAHTVMYLVDKDGLPGAKVMMDRAGLTRDDRFKACLQGLVNAIPRTVVEGKWVRREAETVDRIVAAYFPEIEIPTEEQPLEDLRLDL